MLDKVLKWRSKKSKEKDNETFSCCNRIAFKIDEYLYNQILNCEVVIFAGAGISTETKVVMPYTFYEDIAKELKEENSNLSFPELMEQYSNLPDGKRRLINKIQSRFDYIESFSGLENMATKFHKELATLYPIKTIITTNWDLYFEKYCKAVSFITDKDMAFWDNNKRSVLKIHGSISNYGTIVATSSDYTKALDSLNKGLLGSKLKSILAEKNIVFIGYSFNDTDFQEIYNFVKNSIGEFSKQSYVVTPFKGESIRFKELGFNAIITDGTYFIEEIKNKAIKDKVLLGDEIYTEAFLLEGIITKSHKNIHEKYNLKEYPQMIYVMAYQDGMLNALDRMQNFKGTGEYSYVSYLNGMVSLYDEIVSEKEKNKDFQAVSYFEGYLMILTFFYIPKKERPSLYPPLYFLFDFFNENDKKFKKSLEIFPKKKKKEYSKALNTVSKMLEGTVYHYAPFL